MYGMRNERNETVRASPLDEAIATTKTMLLCTRGYALSAQMSCLQHGYGDRVGVQRTVMILVDDGVPTATSYLLSCRARVSGALVTCPMEGVTGTMAGLGSVPRSSRGVLYGHALYIFFGSCN